jgi:hypothetical protein
MTTSATLLRLAYRALPEGPMDFITRFGQVECSRRMTDREKRHEAQNKIFGLMYGYGMIPKPPQVTVESIIQKIYRKAHTRASK